LIETIEEYRPESPIHDLVWMQGAQGEADRGNVTELRAHRARIFRGSNALPLAQ
jgi:hypothetical protein